MIKWYCDDDLAIYFSQKPEVIVRYLNSNTTADEKCKIYQKPFLLKNNLELKIEDYIEFETHFFNIQPNYTWDGSSIPRFFWRAFGAKTDNRFLIPSLIHDFLCENIVKLMSQSYT